METHTEYRVVARSAGYLNGEWLTIIPEVSEGYIPSAIVWERWDELRLVRVMVTEEVEVVRSWKK